MERDFEKGTQTASDHTIETEHSTNIQVYGIAPRAVVGVRFAFIPQLAFGLEGAGSLNVVDPSRSLLTAAGIFDLKF